MEISAINDVIDKNGRLHGQDGKFMPMYKTNYNRKPNKDFKYDNKKIQDLIKDIEPVQISSDSITQFKDISQLRKWVKNQFKENRILFVDDDKEQIILSQAGAKRSVQKQDVNNNPKNAGFEKISELVKRAKYYDFEPRDEKHNKKFVQGQYIYFSRLNIDDTPYIVRFNIDVPIYTEGTLNYAGHKVSKIKMFLPYRQVTAQNELSLHEIGTINIIPSFNDFITKNNEFVKKFKQELNFKMEFYKFVSLINKRGLYDG